MQSTENTPINTPFFNKIFGSLFNQLLDKGVVFIVMGFIMWIMYNWVQENRKEDRQEISDLRKMVEDCALAKKDKMQADIEGISYKIDRILIKQNGIQ